MKFRPCIDIHNGKVKQIVGGSLTDVQDQADFLVNICDDNLTKDAALKAYNNIFKTESGKKICREMFGLQIMRFNVTINKNVRGKWSL